MAQCTAKSKQSGERCKNNCSPGREKCRLHGGCTPSGFDLPQTKHGLYSKSMPKRLLTDFIKSYNDPKSVELRESIATVEARMADLLKELKSVEIEGCWDKAQVQYHRMENGFNNRDWAEVYSASNELGGLINAGVRGYEIWDEFFKTLDLRRKLYDSQLKWEIASGQWITKEQAITLFRGMGYIMWEEIKDPETMERICKRIEALFDQTPEKGGAENQPDNLEEIVKKSIRKPRGSKRQPNYE